MKAKFLITLYVLILSIRIEAQERVYVSILGTWDKNQDQSRAQFGGNNKLLPNYLNGFAWPLISGSYDTKGVSQVVFRVNSQGNIDSLEVEEGLTKSFDDILKRIILSTNGKWRPGKIDGNYTSEIITLWLYVYNAEGMSKTLEEYIEISESFFDKGDYQKALKNVEKALIYDKFNSRAIVIKYKTLMASNQKDIACIFLNAYKKYQIGDVIKIKSVQ